MARREDQTGRAELRAVRNRGAGLFGWVFLFSLFVNLLMLTGPLYMLQVYDRVLGSRSEETLVALSILAAGLFLAMAVLDHLRGRLLHRISARFQTGLDQRVFQAAIRRMILRPDDPQAHSAQHDLAAIQRFLASSALIALCDLPWTPVFIVAIFVFHPVLGWLALAGVGS